uniref:Hemolysin n=1 Tax=mine drainage metagenome TaxID=410659 RepID=E6PZQ0_9ZZZZ
MEGAAAQSTAVPHATHRNGCGFQTGGIHAEVGRYRLRLAEDEFDRAAVYRLRFRVFNLEMGKGLESAYVDGLDTDALDPYCEHLIVEDKLTDHPHRVVGTYRMQSGITAREHLGYYADQEFDLSPYEAMRDEVLELGRAAVDREHRTPEVLMLLWRGIAQYANDHGLRYLMGCSSLMTTDQNAGWRLHTRLVDYHLNSALQTFPRAGFECARGVESYSGKETEPPRLLKTYLAIGARIASAPAWDEAFGSIDFLTWMDLRTITPGARNRFLAPLSGSAFR